MTTTLQLDSSAEMNLGAGNAVKGHDTSVGQNEMGRQFEVAIKRIEILRFLANIHAEGSTLWPFQQSFNSDEIGFNTFWREPVGVEFGFNVLKISCPGTVTPGRRSHGNTLEE